jgi:hypothetical protein
MLHRSLRIGGATVTAPLGRPTTTVRPDWKPSMCSAKLAAEPSTVARSQARLDPFSPAKQAAPVTAAGAVTLAEALEMNTDHSVPIAFQ